MITRKNLIPQTKLNTEGSATRAPVGRDRREAYQSTV